MKCSAVQCSAVYYSTVLLQYSEVHYSAVLVQYSEVQYIAVQRSVVQCSAVCWGHLRAAAITLHGHFYGRGTPTALYCTVLY